MLTTHDNKVKDVFLYIVFVRFILSVFVRFILSVLFSRT